MSGSQISSKAVVFETFSACFKHVLKAQQLTELIRDQARQTLPDMDLGKSTLFALLYAFKW